jgi:hypothetical protein
MLVFVHPGGGLYRERKTNQFSIFLIKVAAFKGILDGDKISVWPATGLFWR